MSERPSALANLPDAALDRALTDLGREIAFPATPDLAGQVADALRSEQQRPVPVRRSPFWPRGWLVAATLLLLIVLGLLLSPQARTAIADHLGLPGIDIHWLEDDSTPALTPAPDVSALGLGRPVTLAEARVAAPFPVAVPTQAGFAEPAQVYLLGEGSTAMVSLVYPPTPDLPETGTPGVGALLTQFAGSTNRNFIMKGLHSGEDGPVTSIETVSVAGNPGFWIAGAPHTFFLACSELAIEECREERYRLAGNVLLWDDGGVVLRLESGLSREAALAVAVSMPGPDDLQPQAP